MTQKELKLFFKEHLVPKKLYSLKGNHKNRVCMEASNGGWDVYFSDNKNKIGLMHFTSESDACASMAEEIKKIMQSFYGLTWRNL
jgi:hypothetical protein